MKKKLKAMTLIELQIASVLMVVVLIATGVIFYFGLTSIRYIHDAVVVYSNANAAIKALTEELIVSNCYGDSSGGDFTTPDYSFYGRFGYQSGALTDYDASGGGNDAENAFFCMPVYTLGQQNDAIYFRQAPQSVGATTIAGDFPEHDIGVIYRWEAPAGIRPTNSRFQLWVQKENNGRPVIGGPGSHLVAHHITSFSWRSIAYNCVAVTITATGDVEDPLNPGSPFFQIALAKMITLRCAPTVEPWGDD